MSLTISAGQVTRDFAIGLLADPTTGFNPQLATACAARGVTAWTTNFTAPGSNNFYLGCVNPDQIEGDANIVYPFGCIYAQASKNLNMQKYCKFAGTVTVGVDWYLQDVADMYSGKLELVGDAVEAAMLDVFNEIGTLAGGNTIAYNGDIDVIRSKPAASESGWVVGIGSKLSFVVYL